MAKFKDNAGREWTVAIEGVSGLERVAKQADVRLDRLFDDELAGLTALARDPIKLVSVLWVMVEEQAQKTGLTAEQFGRSLGGDSLEAATTALIEAVADFSPSRQRKMIQALTAKSNEVADAQATAIMAAIATIDPHKPKPPTPSASATNSRESSESIPAG